MEVPPLLQVSIALFTAMVASTLLPAIRRSIPIVVEVLLWTGLVTACGIAVVSITDPNARELTASAAWAAGRIINTLIALALGGVGSWMSAHRFPIANWLVIITGADIFALVCMRSMRSALRWQPRVRLREWIEFPLVTPAAVRARRQLTQTDPLVDVNRRLAAATTVAAATAMAKLVDFSVWIRGEMLPREARRIAHLMYAASAWCMAAGSGLLSYAMPRGRIIDITPLISPSLGRHGSPTARIKESPGEDVVADSQRSDRLAS